MISSDCCSSTAAVAAATTLTNHWPRSCVLKPSLIRLFFHPEQRFSLTNSSSISPNHPNNSNKHKKLQLLFFSHFKGKRSRTRKDTPTDIVGSGSLKKIADYLCIDLVGCKTWTPLRCQVSTIQN